MSRRRFVGVVFVVAIAALLAARYQASIHVQPIESYWVVDDTTMGVQVISGPHHSCWIGRTIQTADEVRVIAFCREPYVPALGSTAVGIANRFEIDLGEPLGDRLVVDGLGNPVQRCDPPDEFGPVC